MRRVLKIYYTFFLVCFLFFGFERKSVALFSARVTLENLSFSTSTWELPEAPILTHPEDKESTNGHVYFSWEMPLSVAAEEVLFHLQVFDFSPYPYVPEIDTAPYFEVDTIGGQRYPVSEEVEFEEDGAFWWRVRAYNENGEGGWSDFAEFTVDIEPPFSQLEIEGLEEKLLNEQFENGSFEQGVSDFESEGEVQIWEGDDGFLTHAFSGQKMLKLGTAAGGGTGQYYWQNRLAASIEDNQAKTLSFYYNFFTTDEFPFDSPGFILSVNEESIFQTGADEVMGVGQRSSGWKQVYLDVASWEEMQLDFFAGNNLDTENQSWVYLDQIQTGRCAVNKNTKFIFTSSDDVSPEDKIVKKYQVNSGDWQTYTDKFSLDLSNGEHDLYFKAWDEVGNEESKQVKLLFFDSDAPSGISDLALKNATVDSATIVFTAPFNNETAQSGKVEGYEIRFSENEIEENNWSLAQRVDETFAAAAPGILEEVVIKDLSPDIIYYFAIKSFDAAGNYSEMSNAIEIETQTLPSPTPTISPTVTPTTFITPTPEIE